MKVLTFEDLAPEKGIKYSRPQIWRKIKDGTFPRPVKLGGNRNAWPEHEIDEWLERLIAERDAETEVA